MENIETKLGKIQDLKYQVQEIMISNYEESEKIHEFVSKLDENTARFNFIVADIEKVIKRLNENEKNESKI